MQKKLRKIKTTIILLTLLINVIIIFIPSSSAALLKSDACLNLEFDANVVQKRIKPLDKPTRIPINIRYQVIGKFAKRTAAHFNKKGIPATIELSIEEKPNGCSAIFEPHIVNIEIGTNWNSASTSLLVSFNENVPALKVVKIKVKMHAEEVSSSLFKINEVTDYAEIAVTPGFLLVFDATPKSTFKEISPGETTNFDIDLKNLGNAKTRFRFKILQKPKDWEVKIVADTFLESKLSGRDSTETVQLFVQSPDGIGLNNDQEVIQVSVTATYFAALSEKEQETILSFTVKSSGISTLGLGTIFALFVFIAVILLYYYRHRHRQRG